MSQETPKRILVLGAGLVTRPLVAYLLKVPEFTLTVATRTVSKAERMIADHPRGRAVTLNVEDDDSLRELVSGADLVISLVPYAYHVKVAKLCIAMKRQMVTTSYVSPEMRALDGAAKEAGVCILNEIGLDPGIDHMSAMKIIHAVEDAGGTVAGFTSNCGGLPAPEANTNPWGYKFSWSPRGVVLAARNAARYLWEGELREVPGPELFGDVKHVTVEGLGDFEVYPNRDSMGYREIYGLDDTRTLFRGTFRYPGHCATWKALADLGWLDLEEREVAGMTFGAFFAGLIGSQGDLKADLAAKLGLDPDADPIRRMEWLGLLGGDPVPGERKSPLDVLAERLLAMLPYEKRERDMIILQHTFRAEYPEGRAERIVSTLVATGIPGGDSSMSRTVSLPAAIATRMILQGEIATTGVHVPVIPEIYEPVLAELAALGIAFEDKREDLG
ncbi:MAG: saccharopine dehydrogenase NADP-binding domain-containing protein [Candidatus Krumholzibacteriota bacterium]|nr:saccharopine dehydrogenase NADP-binding domain-containing protein [Candidatus Krumholzibacteriota bacterium]